MTQGSRVRPPAGTGSGSSSAARTAVVVATRNRGRQLRQLLAALRLQEHHDFELVVVDDASEDETFQVLEQESRRGDLGLEVVRRETPGGPGAARNDGWRRATAPLVCFTDDDCEPSPRWLAAMAAAHDADPSAVVQGRTVPHPDEVADLGPLARTMDVQQLGPWFPTCNVAYPREMLERLDGFASRFPTRGEDTDLAWRAKEAGAPTVYRPDALVHHAVNHQGLAGALRFAWGWDEGMRLFAEHTQLRDELAAGLFWRRAHAPLLVTLAGLAAARRTTGATRWTGSVLALVPWARSLERRRAMQGWSRSAVPAMAVIDLVELAATVRGAIRHRTPVL
ncbi:MAG: glycosyltransferase family 2 protein [Solirubrobacterales bacterium]